MCLVTGRPDVAADWLEIRGKQDSGSRRAVHITDRLDGDASPSCFSQTRLFAVLAFGFASTGALAQTTISHSRLDFGNAYRIDREDLFPNSRSATGNASGDFLYKAFPKEVLARDGKIRISGVRVTFSVDKTYTGTFPTFMQMPVIAFFRSSKGRCWEASTTSLT